MSFYEDQFKEDTREMDYKILYCIPTLVSGEQNEEMIRMSDLEEVKNVIFLMN